MGSFFHLGHAFSQAMPEIQSVNGKPLADLIWTPESDPAKLDDNTFIGNFEAALNVLVDENVEVNDALAADIPKDTSPKTHLLESFANFLVAKGFDA